MKKIFKLLIVIGIILFFVVNSINSIGSTKISPQNLEISKGDTIYTLPKKLGFDVNSSFYKAWIKLNHGNFSLKAGIYEIKEQINLDNLFSKVLNKPKTNDVDITILPGWNIYDINDYLEEKGISKDNKFLDLSTNISSNLKTKYPFLKNIKTLEGFIYPETYNIDPKWDLEKIISTTLDQFEKQIYSKYTGTTKNFYNELIMSSIVEKEERNDNNKSTVAGILKNRLNNGVAIGADVTLCYSYDMPYEKCSQDFINENIYKKSTYNTRSQVGLIPTPISNISADTFFATVNNDDTSYFYYLHDNDGNIHYAKTLEEHNFNVQKYLR